MVSKKYGLLLGLIVFLIVYFLLIYAMVFNPHFTIRCVFEKCNERNQANEKRISLQQKTCSKICTSKTCVVIAAELFESMDIETSPCEDFFDHVCGRYPMESFHSFDTTRPTHLYWDWNYETLQTVRKLIEDTKPRQKRFKAKMIYDSCVHSEDPLKEIRSLHKTLSDSILPGWPSVKHDANVAEWIADLMLVQSLPTITIFLVYIDMETFGLMQRPQEMVPSNMSGPGFFLPPGFKNKLEINWYFDQYSKSYTGDIFLDNKIIEMSRELLEALAIPASEVDNILKDALEIQNDLISINENSEGKHKISCSDSQNEQNIFCEIISYMINRTTSSVSLDEIFIRSDYPIVSLEDYFRSISKPKLSNFLAVQYFASNVEILTYTNKYLDHSKEMRSYDIPVNLDSRLRCAHMMSQYFPSALAVDFLTTVKDFRTVSLIENSLDNLKTFLEQHIKSETEKQRLLRQSGLLEVQLFLKPYIDYLKSYNAEGLYSELQPSKDFATNILELKRVQLTERLVDYKIGISDIAFRLRNFLNMDIAAAHQIEYGLGWLRVNYLDDIVPQYMVYARYGQIIMHEFGHIMSFPSIKDCLIRAYENITIPESDIPVDEVRNLVENKPDLIATVLGFAYYKSHIDTLGRDDALPGLPYTNEQLYFYLTSKEFCEFGDSVQYKHYETDRHSPTKYRINIALRNNEAFASAFKCGIDSYMNSEDRCGIPM